MNIKTSTKEHFKIAEIRKPESKTVTILITADLLTENTAKEISLHLLYTDLLLAGAGKLTRDEFLYKLYELGSTINVAENEARITISVSALADKLKPTLKLLETMLTLPTFKSSERTRAVRTIKNALELYKENARALAESSLKNSFFTKESRHYSYSPDLIISAIDSISIDNLKKTHLKLMQSFWTVSIGGSDVSVDATIQFIKKLKKTSAPAVAIIKNSFANNPPARKVTAHEVKSKQNIEISIGANLPLTHTSSDLPAFLFGIAVLGKWGGFAGRLMSTVREKEGLTYGIYARVEGVTVEESGFWRIMTFFSPKDVVLGITSTLREINLIHEKGITQSEWERFQTILKTGETLVFDSLTGTTGLVHNKLVSGLEWNEYQLFRQKLYTCTRSEVNAALKKYLNPVAITISAAGPVAAVKKDLEIFEQFSQK